MTIAKSVKKLRQAIMTRVAPNIGATNLPSASPANQVTIRKVLICRPNHRLGNQLLLTPLIQEVTRVFPGCEIDLFVKGNAGPVIFRNYANVKRIIQLERKPFSHFYNYLKGWTLLKEHQYDLVINVTHNSSSGRIATRLANAPYKLFCGQNSDIKGQHEDYRHMAKYPVYYLRYYLPAFGRTRSEDPVPLLDLKLSDDEIAQGRKLLAGIVPPERKTISIFTYATGDKLQTGAWWMEFYQGLKEAFPAYNIVEILPVENVSQIGFQAAKFYSRDIRDIAALIANTELFVGADSGMMHLASASLTPTIGLFSVTDPRVYEPYSAHSAAIDTGKTDIAALIARIGSILTARQI